MEVNIDIVLRHNYWVAPVEKRRCFVDQVLHNNWVRQHNWLVLMVKLLSSAFRKCDFAISFSSYVSWYWTLVGRPNPFPVHLCTEKKNCQILVSCKINCLVKENGRTKKQASARLIFKVILALIKAQILPLCNIASCSFCSFFAGACATPIERGKYTQTELHHWWLSTYVAKLCNTNLW